jgi:hypothetical protein
MNAVAQQAMTPDEICDVLESSDRGLVALRLAHGWSFYAGTPRYGVRSNRVLRASAQGEGAAARVKLAISSRLRGRNIEATFAGGTEELLRIVDEELALYRAHFRTG